jgi:hypothetical protein
MAITTPASRPLQPRQRLRRAHSLLALPFALLIGVILGGAVFVSYVLWPTWPGAPVAPDAPALPITVAGVLFNVPPAAIRVAVQRQPGPHDRVDLAFVWPSLTPPTPQPPVKLENGQIAEPVSASDRLFVTIAGAGTLLPPEERLKSIYPRYVEAEATQGPDGLAILPFRTGTPYQGEDLVYVAAQPEQFFARCTRPSGGGATPGTCIHERPVEAAEITLRFPRNWLKGWRNVAASFDRLIGQLHPQHH